MKTARKRPLPKSDSSQDPSSSKNRNIIKESADPVVVKPHAVCIVRLPVEQFFNPKEDDDYPTKILQRDLFLQAFKVLMDKESDDPRSFYQIGGIHGLPYTPYDNVNRPDFKDFTGYCAHGSVLFPTWHRPYMLLIEQEIINCALKFIELNFPANNKSLNVPNVDKPFSKDEYIKVANEIRFPYWDWASHRTKAFGVPQIFLDHTVNVTYPAINTIENPLRCFVLPVEVVDQRQKYSCAPQCIPTASPNYKPKEVSGTPVTPKDYPTVRNPNERYESNDDQMQLQFIRNCTLVLRPCLHDMFQTPDYVNFSNHFASDNTNPWPTYGIYSSLEFVHDCVHTLIGGDAGHMSYPEVAGFDPIFFFHHSNVDRLLAIWQTIYPNEWVTSNISEEGDNVNSTTDLTPFRKSLNPKLVFWNADTVRDFKGLGYTYPEFKDGRDPEELKRATLQLYKPVTWEGVRIIAKVSGVDKYRFDGPYKLMLFVDLKDDVALNTPVTDVHFAGSVSIFTRGNGSKCGQCNINKARGKRMTFTHDITATFSALNMNRENLPGSLLADPTAVFSLHVAIVAEFALKRYLLQGPKVQCFADLSALDLKD